MFLWILVIILNMINELLSDIKKEFGINGYVECCLYDYEFFMFWFILKFGYGLG